MKFSIITPAYNMEKWIRETIESILSQEGKFEIEYIVVDDGSTDSTFAIAEEYRKKIEAGKYPIKCQKITMQCISQKNAGAIVAMNNGFKLATGDIYTWMDADNTYEPGAFNTIHKIFITFPKIKWVKGITSTIDEKSNVIRKGMCKIYHQDWIRDGIYGQESYFIEQDSVFWRKELWEKSGPMPSHFRSAGDYWLWIQIAKYAPLWSVNVPLSNFRKREGQLSKGISKYKSEQWEARPKRTWKAWKARVFFSPQSRLTNKFPKLNEFFIWLYPKVFPYYMPTEYIAVENDHPVIKKANSFIIR
jgi:glycosyltransferase involved in cell wall biosynthesis